jgi:hypothetical protein
LALVALVALTARAGEPRLLPGEGLAVLGPDGGVATYGEAERPAPMGSLAKLVWLDREGEAWERDSVRYRCTGKQGAWSCWNREGHGDVDLAQACQASCNLAFLAWARASLARAGARQGEGAARARLEAAFAPFLEGRMPEGDRLPALTPEWIGTGQLLRTRPAAFLRWLADPARAALRARCRRLLPEGADGWVKTGTAALPGDPLGTCAWAAGQDGDRLVVLRVPLGRGKREGLARYRALLAELR